MTTLGKNVKITAPESARIRARTIFEVLGARHNAISDRFDVFSLDGANVGYEYTPDATALTPEQMRIAPWLEFVVTDVTATTSLLAAQGVEQIEYRDKDHPYFVGPGGVVFRLAAAS